METLRAGELKELFQKTAEVMEQGKQLLVDLDAAVGDGDLGLTMSRGFRNAADELRDSEESDVGKLLMKAGMVIAKTAPSTMGTLMATGFMRGGKGLVGREEIGLSDLADMMGYFVEGIMERGKSKPGEKTAVDVFYPAWEALKRAGANSKTLAQGLEMAHEAAVQGVEATKGMTAIHGRVAYYGEKSVGKQDPGATAGMLVIKAFFEFASRTP